MLILYCVVKQFQNISTDVYDASNITVFAVSCHSDANDFDCLIVENGSYTMGVPLKRVCVYSKTL